jgi:ATP-binding cassette subfamily B protein
MLVCIPFGALFIDTLLPYFFSQAIGGLSTNNTEAVRNNLIFSAGIGLVGVLLNVIGFQTMIRHEANVRRALSDKAFKTIINKDLGFFVNQKVGALTSRFIDFIRAATTLQDLFIIRTLGFVMSVGVGLVIVAFNSLILAGIIALLIIMLIVQVKWSIKKRTPWRKERKELIGEIHGSIADAVTNNLIVKTFAQEATETNKISEKNARFRDVYVRDFSFMSFEGSMRVLIMTVVQIIAVSFCAYLIFNNQMDIAMAIFSLTYLQRIASQLFTLGEMLNGYDQVFLDAAPMSEMLAKEIDVTDRKNAKTISALSPTIEFKDTSYSYKDGKDHVIDNVNLSIPAGQKVGIVGHSGAGKTTITHLLLRFADVTNGSISVDGHDIRDITQNSLREHIAYVPQEPMLFHRSLRENIAYGKLNATDEEIRWAAKQANAIDFIKDLPNGLDTEVGERGVKLSGGQRQRIAIARAILKDAPILVLDEATSALDSESEKLIQDALSKLMEGRTSIVIAHRLSTIAKLDRIIVLDSGKIAEDGTHAELLKQKGIYANLWAHQSNGLIEE